MMAALNGFQLTLALGAGVLAISVYLIGDLIAEARQRARGGRR